MSTSSRKSSLQGGPRTPRTSEVGQPEVGVEFESDGQTKIDEAYEDFWKQMNELEQEIAREQANERRSREERIDHIERLKGLTKVLIMMIEQWDDTDASRFERACTSVADQLDADAAKFPANND